MFLFPNAVTCVNGKVLKSVDAYVEECDLVMRAEP